MEYHYSDKNNSKFNHIGPDYISKPSHAKCLSLMLQAILQKPISIQFPN